MTASSKRTKHRAFTHWLSAWLVVCLFYSFMAGGVNCKCPPPEPDGELEDVDGGPKDDCYCVEPGSPCKVDGNCRTRLKYCIFLVCQQGVCRKPPKDSLPDIPLPPDVPRPDTPPQEQQPRELLPTCPKTCRINDDCTKELCGDNIICENSTCQPGPVIPP